MIRRSIACILVATAVLELGSLQAVDHRPAISTVELKDWLTFIASDQLKGRAVFTEGLGLAAGYIQNHLQSWGVKPAGDAGGYLQTVRVLGVKGTRRSTVTVHVGNDSRTFTDGDGVSFPANAGDKQTLTVDRVEFVGYGLDLAVAGQRDFRGRNVDGAAVVFLGNDGPKSLDRQYRRLLAGRRRYATDQLHAAATVGPRMGATPPASARPPGADVPDFTTTQRLDRPIAPSITGNDEFFEFLFSHAPVSYPDLRRRAGDREQLPHFRLDGVRMTFNVDVDYRVVRTQLTQNVVAIVEGDDPQLKNTYVAFGAHYDHVGYADTELRPDGTRPAAPGRITSGASDDRIWNGADDDGSGTVALMALAQAFAKGPRPKRSLLFVWHTGEERGLYGSRYFADYPTVPIDAIVSQLNIDMIGRNRDDKQSEANTVYLVGSDRISSELNEVNREANKSLQPPLTLNYEMNDPADVEQVYYRSDHYSYAAKGIPIIFFTTGMHPDYHANTDDVSRIEFPKMARVIELVYETGWRVANMDHAPVRDNKGPRAGKGTRQ